MCGSSHAKVGLTRPYSDARIADYLTRYYNGQASLTLLEGEHYTLLECSSCGLIYQRDVPSDAMLSEIYDRWIPPRSRSELAAQYGLAFYAYTAEQVHWLIRHFRKSPAELKVLDFGFGWAEWAQMARAYGCEVHGAELSAERVAYARSIGLTVIDAADIKPATFDYINTEQVFEHLVDPLPMVRILAAALKPGGVLRLTVPDGHGVQRVIDLLNSDVELEHGALMPIHPLEHINCFRVRSLDMLAAKGNLRPLKPRLRDMYNAATGWLGIPQAAKNIIRPIYRHVFPRSTFGLYEKPSVT